MNNKPPMSDAEKFSLIKCEAIYTALALAGLIIFWLIAGFGTSAFGVKIFYLPIWVILGTVGVWIFAIFLSGVLSRLLFKDITFEEGDGND